MFTSNQLMIHGTNTQKLLLFGNKRHLEEEQQVHTYSCVNTSSHKSAFPPYQLWLCGGVRRCQRFPQNNVTRRGIPVRPRKREREGREDGGERRACPNRAGRLTSLKPALAPSRGSFSPSPSLFLFVCGRGRNVMCPANCWLPNSSLTG